MKYTTEQAVEKALSVSKLLTFGNSFVDMSHDELAEFANLIRDETLLEAAEMFRGAQMDNAVFMLVAYRMAGE